MLRPLAVALAGVLAAFSTASAQSDSAFVRLRGIAFDSLRGRPLSAAFVAVVGGGWTAPYVATVPPPRTVASSMEPFAMR